MLGLFSKKTTSQVSQWFGGSVLKRRENTLELRGQDKDLLKQSLIFTSFPFGFVIMDTANQHCEGEV